MRAALVLFGLAASVSAAFNFYCGTDTCPDSPVSVSCVYGRCYASNSMSRSGEYLYTAVEYDLNTWYPISIPGYPIKRIVSVSAAPTGAVAFGAEMDSPSQSGLFVARNESSFIQIAGAPPSIFDLRPASGSRSNGADGAWTGLYKRSTSEYGAIVVDGIVSTECPFPSDFVAAHGAPTALYSTSSGDWLVTTATPSEMIAYTSFVGAFFGKILFSNNRGKSWEVLHTAETPLNFAGIDCVDDGAYCVAAASGAGRVAIFTSRTGGAWKSELLRKGPYASSVRVNKVNGKFNAFVSGSLDDSSGEDARATVFYTTPGTTSWNVLTLGKSDAFHGMHVQDEGTSVILTGRDQGYGIFGVLSYA